MKAKLAVIILLLMLFIPYQAIAESDTSSGKWTPIQLAADHPVQAFDENWNVYGLRINILYGKNNNVYGLDIGGVNECQNMGGIQLAYSGNYVHRSMTGFQIGLFKNASGEVNGGQIVGFTNNAKKITGFQLAILGNDADKISGIQLGLLNKAKDISGIQLGAINIGDKSGGLQIGLVNYCEKVNGLQIQIGVANIIKDGMLPFFPIINAGFSF